MSEYMIENGMSREERWVWADQMEEFRTVRTSMGHKYRVRLTAEEIESRRRAAVAATVGLMTPACIAILAAAAGLI